MTERKFRIYGPIILSVFLLIFFYAMLIGTSDISIRWAIIPLVYSILAWESGRVLVLFCRKQIPGITHVKKRIALLILTGIPVAALMGLINNWFTILLGLYTHFSFNDYFFITGLYILCFTIVIGVYECYYYLQQWKMLFVEAEQLKKDNTNSQFQFLKEQIKPHFLFNSLNTLSALISINPVKAELYVEEMSTVYRYLLSKNEKELTTLQEELLFLDSYLLMLRTRFEESLIVNINVQDRLTEYLLPPFVLQLLIENAVKHNVISKNHPLVIDIFTDDKENLHVVNNLQLKIRPERSENKGLANIILRYSLLNKKDQLRIEKENGLFKVIIPLMKTNVFAVTNLLSA